MFANARGRVCDGQCTGGVLGMMLQLESALLLSEICRVYTNCSASEANSRNRVVQK
jgi:hypothetical protein